MSKARSKKLLDRAVAAMVAAIDLYNKPDFAYRAESFTILALNAWELLLKAKWVEAHGNRLNSLYVVDTNKKKNGKRPVYQRTHSGYSRTHDLNYLANKLHEQKVLDEACRKNLEALTELRNTAVHFYHRNSSQLAQRVQEIGMAAVKNFASAVQDWFNEDLSRFNFYLMPLSFVTPPPVTEAVQLNKKEKNFLRYIDELDDTNSDPTAKYSVAINIEVKFVRSKSTSATPVRVTNDPNAPAVHLTEEQVTDRYPWDYKELTTRCKERYADFRANQKYHELRKDLENDKRYCYVRLLDPKNINSSKKMFYNPIILEEFDKHYTRKK